MANNPNRPVEKVSWDDAQIFLTRLNAQQSANIPAGWAYVLPTEVAMGVCLPSRYDHGIFLGCIRLRRAMLITHRVVLARRVMRATMPPILGAFSICTEMSGSGRRTGTELTVREHRQIPQVRHRAPPVLFGAGLGTYRRRPAFGQPLRHPPSVRYAHRLSCRFQTAVS